MRWKGQDWIEDEWMWNKCSSGLLKCPLLTLCSTATPQLLSSPYIWVGMCLCGQVKLGACLTLTCVLGSVCNLRVTCVCVCVVCMMPYAFYTKWLRPTECSTGIHTLNHTVKHYNSKSSRKWGRNTSHKQTGGVAWESAPWQTPAATAPSWQSALEGNKLDFKINVPPNRNSLLLWLNSCKGQTSRCVCCRCLMCVLSFSTQKLMGRTETKLFFILKPTIYVSVVAEEGTRGEAMWVK